MIALKFLILLFSISLIYCRFNVIVPKSELKNKSKSLISLDTDLGTIIGYKQNINISNVIENRVVNVFYGVPYAEPPIGKLRFKKPKPITEFPNEPYLGLDFKSHCVQAHSIKYHKDDKFSEDCLYMNIWTPDLEFIKLRNGKCLEKYSVIVYFYGGQSSIFKMSPFTDKNNNSHLSYNGGLFAALKDTIYVTVNFRQNLFANLYLENHYPANLGLWDQNLAIRWVKNYIGNFCGDDNITLQSNSIQGQSISIHSISSKSKHLFEKAILQSPPTFFYPKTPNTKNEMLINSFLAIHKLGCLNTSSEMNLDLLDKEIRFKYFFKFNNRYFLKETKFEKELNDNWLKTHPNVKIESKLQIQTNQIEKDLYLNKKLVKLVNFLSKYIVNFDCLTQTPIEKFINLGDQHNEVLYQSYYDFDYIDKDAYLDYKLFNKFNVNPKLKILIGVTKDEECVGVDLIKDFYSDTFNAPIINKEEVKEMIKNFRLSIINQDEFNSRMANYYANESRWTFNNGFYDAINNIKSDYNINCVNLFYSHYSALSGINRVYNYLINYRPTTHFASNRFRIELKDSSWIGLCHGDETTYVMGQPFRYRNIFTDFDRKFSLKLMELWTSFARNGRMPRLTNSNQWPFASKSNPTPRYIEINAHFTREFKFEFEDRCMEFWKDLLWVYKK